MCGLASVFGDLSNFVRAKQTSAEGRQDILGLWQAPTYYAKTSRCQTSPVSVVAVCARQVCKFGRAGQTGKFGQVLLQAWEGSWGSSGEPWRRSEGGWEKAGRSLGAWEELGRKPGREPGSVPGREIGREAGSQAGWADSRGDLVAWPGAASALPWC